MDALTLKCPNDVNFFTLKKLLMLTYGIILTISGRDTLRPLGTWLRPSQITYGTLITIKGVVLNGKAHVSCMYR